MATKEVTYFDRVQGRAAFGFKLYQSMVKQDPESNTFISPVSIGLLLAMLYHGARGRTQDEIAAALAVLVATSVIIETVLPPKPIVLPL